jgi:hypothetical protein
MSTDEAMPKDFWRRLINEVSIRGRVSFVLAIAEQVVEELSGSPDGYSLAQEAIEKAWEWQGTLEITGDNLYAYLENEDDSGLLVHEWEANEDDEEVCSAWISLTSAIAYVTWHAYKQNGINVMPSSIWEVSEDTIGQVLDYAMRTSVYNPEFTRRLIDYLVSECRSTDSSDLGEPCCAQKFRSTVKKT